MTIRRLTRNLHISWLVAAWCLGLTVGVIAVHHLPRSVEFNNAGVIWRDNIVCASTCLAVAGAADCGDSFW